ncbi:MAG: acetylornithine deacetylase (ArgE), partial [Ilumatobacteraceae bacterium]|nr:acetylornithine deacetylase (ArgE) [Ilumatobacteraceae bacterium]
MLICLAPATHQRSGAARAPDGASSSRASGPGPGYIRTVQHEPLGDIGSAGLVRTLELLAHLVTLPTESRTSNRALIEWTADHLRTFGASVSIIDGHPGRANLLATMGPEQPGGLLLSAHTDVVAA